MALREFSLYLKLLEFRDSTINCFRFARIRIPVVLFVGVLLSLYPWTLASASTWTRVANGAPSGAGVMLLLTDGTVMIQQGTTQNWMHLTPNASGSYINGVWSLNPIAPMSTPRLYFASHVLNDGRVWLLGGEYSGPGLIANWSGTAEIYDPLTNSWSSAATYPPTSGCPTARSFGGFITAGSSIVTGILSTAGWQSGWSVSGGGIPGGTTIASVDSPTQIHLSGNATSTTSSVMTLTTLSSGNTVAGSNIITGIPSTSGFQTLWGVAGSGIPANASIIGIDSATQIRISANATATASGVPLTLTVITRPPACFGDDPSMLLPNGKILVGNLLNSLTYIYDPATNLWSSAIPKVHNDRSDEETWARMSDGTILTYDLFQSISTGGGYAERFNPLTNLWSGISPSAGTAAGFIPQLSSATTGSELGGILRLYDDRMFVIGATGHTALYTRATNTWAAGPDLNGTLGGAPFLFSADDAPAAILPNGHVIMAVDAGLGLTTTGTTTAGSTIITGIPSTASFQLGWAVSGSGIPAGATLTSIDSSSQVHISTNATVTASGTVIKFGTTFSKPTVLLDYDPVAETISPVFPALPDPNLNNIPAYVTRMLMLPTGELLFSDSSSQLWVYTPDGVASPGLRPAITGITRNGSGFILSGTQITGQSSGASYGDDVESDEDYPIIRLVSPGGNVYYARTTNWNPIGVGTGSTPQTVNFTISPAVPLGIYSLIVSAAGISSDSVAFTVGPDLSIEKEHSNNFFQGQAGAIYTIAVSNVGSQPTSGTVTVSESIPAGLTPVSISGTNWICSQPAGPCTQSAALLPGSPYPNLTLTVNVDPGAPSSVTNTVSVTGGGDVNPLNNTASDLTTIQASTLSSPILVSPPDGATNVSITPILTWNAVAGASSYDVYLGTTPSPPFLANTDAAFYAAPPLSVGTAYYWRVDAKNATTSATSLTSSFMTGVSASLRFVPVTPCRVADTRLDPGPYGGPIIEANATRDFIIPGICGVPASAEAFSLNVAVVPSESLGYLTVWPAGQSQPLVSTLNSLDGRIKSSNAIIPAGSSGAISVFANGSTNVVIDISGYFVSSESPQGLVFYPLPPCRIADTRLPTAPLGGPSLTANSTRSFPVRTACGLPESAQAYSLNLTVAPGIGNVNYLTAWATGQSQPFVSALNSSKPGEITANAAILPAGINGDIDVFVTNDTDLVIDINGYFAPPGAGGLSYFNVSPCRVLDTREPSGSPPFSGIADINVSASGCGIPAGTAAFVFNATIVPTAGLGYLTFWPQGGIQPLVSTLNDLDGSITNNLAIVPTNNGAISVFATDSTHLVMDVFGYFAP